MYQMDKLELISKKINNASSIGIVTHINPDGDAIGSTLALWRVLSIIGKKCDALCDSPIPKMYMDCPYIQAFSDKTQNDYDLMISVDVSDPARCGCFLPLFEKGEHISIDHHSQRVPFAKINYVEMTSSSAELIFRLLDKFYNQYISKEVAELLYIALLTDCGGFAFEYVNENTFYTASKLITYGINNSLLYRKYLREKPLSQVKMASYVITHAVYECGGQLAFLVFDKETLEKFGCDMSQTSDCLQDLMRAREILVGISLTEVKKNLYKVSIRTKGNEISASEIAREFGGGGHKNASGCQLNGCLGVVLDKLTFAVSKVI